MLLPFDDRALQAHIDAAGVYERLLVPAEFQEWAPRMVAAAHIEAGHKVLDVACGTGVLSSEAALRVGPTGFVAGLDADRGMLAVASQLTPAIEWREGSAESLPYPDHFFDAVVCQFGLMFFDDRDRALREMWRVLAPAGHLAIAVWDSLDNTPAYAELVALLERIAGRRAADALRVPFVLGNRNALASLFSGAGMPPVTIATHPGTAQYPSIRSLVEADLRSWLPAMGVVLPDYQILSLLEEAEHVLGPWVTSTGSLAFASPAHIVTGVKR